VAIYARSATEPNPDGIAAQIAACELYCQQQGWNVVITATDEGVSGLTLDRPGLTQILTLIASGGVDIVLADGSERFARDIDLMQSIIATCKDHGVRCQTLASELSESLFVEPDTPPNSRAFARAAFKL
jgi:DNA invertase Pin-like site-specific DNA recombinase